MSNHIDYQNMLIIKILIVKILRGHSQDETGLKFEVFVILARDCSLNLKNVNVQITADKLPVLYTDIVCSESGTFLLLS